MPEILLAPGTEEIGLAFMLEGLISQNLEDRPEKLADFNKLAVGIGLIVTDADLGLTLEFGGGRLVIQPGISERAGLVVTAETDVIMALSNQRIKWGLPYYFDQVGREIFSAMKTGRLKVKGLAHFPSLVRFSRLMSVV